MNEDVAATNEQLLRAYRTVFATPHGQQVLQDLMRFCHFRVPIAVNGRDDVLIAEGGRRVFCRIMQMIALTPGQMRVLYGGGEVTMEDEE